MLLGVSPLTPRLRVEAEPTDQVISARGPNIRPLTNVSLITQSDYRIGAHGAPGGNVTSRGGYQRKQESDAGEGQRVDRADAEEQAAHELCQPQRGHHAHTDSNHGQARSLPQNEAHYIERLRAKRDANAHLARTLRNRIRDKPYNPTIARISASAAKLPMRKEG